MLDEILIYHQGLLKIRIICALLCCLFNMLVYCYTTITIILKYIVFYYFNMPKVEWGLKKICPNCETKFYDLNRKPAVCPNCGQELEEENSQVPGGTSKQVINDNLDVSTDTNLVGSDPSESIAEVEDINIEDAIDEDTISLEDTEDDVNVDVIDEEVDDLNIESENNEDIEN